MIRIAICAPGKPISRETAQAASHALSSHSDIALDFHEQCFLEAGHFAGDDAARLAALVECANDTRYDALWFAAGGYGTSRITAEALSRMSDAARAKRFVGYSDTGYLLAALYRHGIGHSVHGPMISDVNRTGGEAAIIRAAQFIRDGKTGVEPDLDQRPVAAFNLTTLAMLCGTDFMPDLSGHVVMIEEVSEHLYAVDRLFFQITAHLRGIAGIRLGRISDIPQNDRPFGLNAEEIARFWCEKSGIAYLGRADIGHDTDNKIVPFGLAARGGVA